MRVRFPRGTRVARSGRWAIPTGSLRVGLLLLLCLAPSTVVALEELWESLCSTCHSDDRPTCAGCHNHGLILDATPHKSLYRPGELVRIQFRGGNKYGWLRALLYDESGNELFRATGPTESGDDARGLAVADSVTFPVELVGVAPSEPGEHAWRAAYFGILHMQNVTHGEDWVEVPIHVALPDSIGEAPTWGRVKRYYW